MGIFGRKLLTATLLALYGGISLLGYGLHELSPAHQHADTSGHAPLHSHQHAHSHAGCSHHGHHARPPLPDGPNLYDAHECDICIFLDQSRSEPPQLIAVDNWQPLLETVGIADVGRCSAPLLGLPDSRGPPLHVS